MATLILSAAGMALGGTMTGSVMGLSMAAIGRAGGAMLGRAIDQRLMGNGAKAVQTGRVDRFRLMGASEGTPIPQAFGRVRLGGQVIWATKFLEKTSTSTVGGKGAPSATQTSYSYCVSLAVAVCEGEISRIGRIWADGKEISPETLTMRVYPGNRTQLPDPKIEAVQGTGNAPAFRGTAYVVFEDLELEPFGNRVPQFSFEVLRPTQARDAAAPADLADAVTAVALMPGSGEYALATTPVYRDQGQGRTTSANVHTGSGQADLTAAIDGLGSELPHCQSTSLIVSWFGDDLRCGHCTLTPRVEETGTETASMPWTVSGLTRDTALAVPQLDARPSYGGTPTDQSVIEAIQALTVKGQAVMFYPFILMTQLEGNTLPNPWSDDPGQPHFPWRGRITTSVAPSRDGTTDGTATAQAEVDAFFGTAVPADFTPAEDRVSYTGPDEWSYRRFILHYAHLCALAGGVDAFCIGSEMRSLTWIRGAAGQFVAVEKLIALAADVRSILGPDVKISYAADWSEYFGYQPQDGTNDRYFHLDALWADPNIDFIGIDNYMPLSDWRDGCDHLDWADGRAIHNLDYLQSNVEGGEGFDWYYTTSEARDAQFRTAIEDASESEPWAFRYKDIRGWWANPHYNRVGGVRSLTETAWVPQSKPIWFTELGCAAVDKATNQPNKFLDPKSSESTLPHYSNGRRDELIQMQYVRAMFGHWSDPANNPVSIEYNAPMLDMTRAHVWAWDARPYPAFPNQLDVWSDGENYARGHWINGRSNARPLDSLVAEICAASGVTDVDVSQLYGYVRGYVVPDVSDARSALQPLMLAFGFDAVERDGLLVFRNRTGRKPVEISADELVLGEDTDPPLTLTRDPDAEIMDRVRLNYVQADGSFEVAATETVFPEDDTHSVAVTDLNLVMTTQEAQETTERWLAEARVSRDTARFALPPSKTPLGAADVVSLDEPGGRGTYRIDHVEVAGQRLIEAVRIEEESYLPGDAPTTDTIAAQSSRPALVAAPVYPLFLDLPMMTGDEQPHSPHAAVTADPWPGMVRMYQSTTDSNYSINGVFVGASVIGTTQTPMAAARHGIFDHGPALEVDLTSGALSSVSVSDLLAGRNVAAIGDGTPDNWEVFQFQNAAPLGAGRFALTTRLRGQLGTDALMPSVWPVGSVFVLLNAGITQTNLPSSSRGVGQYFKFGSGTADLTHPSIVSLNHAFQGNGLRPYAPVSLNADQSGPDLELTWIRRTRLDGDPWTAQDPPLHEAFERYRVEVIAGGTLVRSQDVPTTSWTYSQSDQAADGVSGPISLRVAQISDVYGPGLHRSLDVII